MEAKYITHTLKLPIIIRKHLRKYANKHNKKECDVMEEIVTNFIEEKIKEDFADSCRRMKDDPEQKFLAEAG
ncbi:MAG: hypothetical protein JWQ40_4429 [Segetibacter sp.]|nr:hypothetical protein [Segetibacter sp.]